jgi:hypothetical protein
MKRTIYNGAQFRINSSVGIAMGYCIGGWNSIPGWERNFSLHHSVQTGSWSRQTSYTMGTSSPFAECKSACAWSWPLTFTWCPVQEWLSSTPTPLYVFMAWYLIKPRDVCTLYLVYFLSSNLIFSKIPGKGKMSSLPPPPCRRPRTCIRYMWNIIHK